MKLKPDSGRF